MKRLIDVGLEQLASMLFRMGELAHKTVSLSIMNYIEGLHNPKEIADLSDKIASMAEEVEDTAFEIMVRFQPVASDLRILKSYMKISYDFTRYGRYALDISQIYERVGGIDDLNSSFKKIIREMVLETMNMVEISIKSLKNHDVDLANSLSRIEEKVDRLYYKYLDKVLGAKTSVKCTISSLFAVRYLERIADHATYIGESIIYLVLGDKKRLR